MLKTIILLPDGRELSSGAEGAAILDTAVRSAVNEGTQLNLGAVCPTKLTCRITGGNALSVKAGDTLTVYRLLGSTRHKLGVFLAGQPRYSGTDTLEITAEDRLCLLEKDLSEWLDSLDGWPYTLGELADMACAACGLELDRTALLSAGCPVGKFSGQGVTGKRLLSWIGELGGCFLQADPDGNARFGWYAPLPYTELLPTAADAPTEYCKGDLFLDVSANADDRGGLILPEMPAVYAEENLHLTLPKRIFCYAGSVNVGQPVEKIARVYLRSGGAGTAVPEDSALNTYTVSSSLLLNAIEKADLPTVAQELLHRLEGLAYTPCTLKIPASAMVEPGSLVQVGDLQGNRFVTCVMKTVTENHRTTLSATGDVRRDDPQAIRDQLIKEENGKLLLLQAGVNGLQIENSLGAEKLARLELTMEGIDARVTQQDGLYERMSRVEQTAESLDISVRTIRQEGVDRIVTKSGYSFTDEGLVISKQGHQMRNLLDHTGMYVTRGEEVILQASDRGVEATDVRVHNYLIIGDHARFEDYDNGTACFYI